MTIIIREISGAYQIADIENGTYLPIFFAQLNDQLDKKILLVPEQKLFITLILDEGMVVDFIKTPTYPITVRHTHFTKKSYELLMDDEDKKGGVLV